MKRRRFIVTAGSALTAAAAVHAPSVIAQPKVQWRLSTTWTPALKKISTAGDFKGLRMRIVNLGGKVYARAGATTVLTPGSEIYAALERGVHLSTRTS